jgi:hypothetical protein
MWLLTPDGFYSIVQKPGERDLCIRGRVALDLDRLRHRYLPSLSETLETPDGDYRYRAWASHGAVAGALSAIARDIDYGNFKDEVARHDPNRAELYGSVWAAL